MQDALHEAVAQAFFKEIDFSQELIELTAVFKEEAGFLRRQQAVMNLVRLFSVYNYPSVDSLESFSGHLAGFSSGTDYVHTEKGLKAVTKKLLGLSFTELYNIAEVEASGKLWFAVLTSFSQEFVKKCSENGPQSFLDFLKHQINFLINPKTEQHVRGRALKEIYNFIGNTILPKLQAMMQPGMLSYEQLQEFKDVLVAAGQIPHHTKVLTARKELAEKLEKILELVNVALDQKKAQTTDLAQEKPNKLCLILHGTCVECGAPSTMQVIANALRADATNAVYEFGGPKAPGWEAGTIVDEAFKVVKARFLSWIQELKEPVTDFDMVLAGFSRGAVNGFRLSHKIHQWLLEDATLEQVKKLLPAGIGLKDHAGQELDFEKSSPDEIRMALQDFFLDKVHIDFHAHDPVPGQLVGIISNRSTLGGGWGDRESFQLPAVDFDLHRRLSVIFAEHEERDMFVSMLDEQNVRGSFERLINFRDTCKATHTIQVLAGSHSAGSDLVETRYSALIQKYPVVCDLFADPDFSVSDLIEKFRDDGFWKKNAAFACLAMDQLLALVMAEKVIGKPLPPAIAVGSREDGRVKYLTGRVTAEDELKMYALMKTHLSFFEDLTWNNFVHGLDRATHHKRESCPFLANRETGRMRFFQNEREISIIEQNYPALYNVLEKAQGWNRFAAPENVEQLSHIAEELTRLTQVDALYAMQVIMCLACNERKKSVTFNNSKSSNYWLKIMPKDKIEEYVAKIMGQKADKILDVVDEFRREVQQKLASRAIPSSWMSRVKSLFVASAPVLQEAVPPTQESLAFSLKSTQIERPGWQKKVLAEEEKKEKMMLLS